MNVVEQAILAAFSGRNAAEANTYLREFSETPEAWKISAQLFHSDSEIVQYFASNILYTKVREIDLTCECKKSVDCLRMCSVVAIGSEAVSSARRQIA